MENENYYITSDLALVAALALTEKLEHIDKKNPKRIAFSFKDTDKVKHKVDQYWRKELRVEPQAYFNQIRVLKTMIYEK